MALVKVMAEDVLMVMMIRDIEIKDLHARCGMHVSSLYIRHATLRSYFLHDVPGCQPVPIPLLAKQSVGQ